MEMKNYNLLSITLLSFLVMGCWNAKKTSESDFSFNNSKLKEQYLPNDSVLLEIKNTNNKKIDSIVYYANDTNIGSKKGAEQMLFVLKSQKLGYQNLKALVFSEGSSQEITSRVELVSDVEPKLLKYTIVNMYPHDVNSFTEGLEFYKDTLYESAGQYKESRLLKTDYKTGKILKSLKLDDKYFGEGITFLNDKIYQLTYREKVGFIYDAKTWKLEKTFPYDKLEGWGMTNDGTNLLFNDSSEKIWKMDPNTQKAVDFINVYSSSSKIPSINELEWINGKIYTNIWQKDAVAIVNPINGAVEGILNLTDLRKSLSSKITTDDVLNGIAYNPKTKTIFVTGKNWDKMFEIKVSE